MPQPSNKPRKNTARPTVKATDRGAKSATGHIKTTGKLKHPLFPPGARKGVGNPTDGPPNLSTTATSDASTVTKPPPFVPPTNPPEFAVEQALHTLARKIVRAAWVVNRTPGAPGPDLVASARDGVLLQLHRAVNQLLGP